MTTYEPGSVIAGYRIDSLIGRGGMAVVYRAEDVRLGRKVALKLLTPQRADQEQFRQRFIQESRLAASLDHPNIVPIYGAGDADGQLYIAMRYVVGSDLKGLLADQGGRLPLDWTLGLFGQIADALDAAHHAGLVHRDVKPANILVAENQERPDHARGYHVYLTDFGLTKRTSETGGLTDTGHFLGTVDYVSPEQIQGKPVGPATDMYALGCVLYECLTGLPPFRRDDDAGLLWAHLVETPPPVTAVRPEIPAAVDAVVARAMAKDPADRYGSGEELVHDLESALEMPAVETAEPDAGAAFPVPIPVDDVYESAPAASNPSALEQDTEPLEHDPELEHEPDAGLDPNEREPFALQGLLAVDDGRPHVVAAADPTPPVPTEGPRSSGSRRRPVVRLVVIGLLAVLLGGIAVGANLLDPVDAMSSVVAEPADSTGADPFTPASTGGGDTSDPVPAGGGSAPDTEGGAPTENVPVSGDTPGLYGGTGTEVCDAEAMVAFFDDHPDQAAAWAAVQGIEPSEIPSYLSSLTPVLLRTDTAVTNHGYRDGTANAYQAVLEAGTAVMVDEYGVPRVRCACGNPLAEPESSDQVQYTGDPWSELGHRPVTIIEAAPVAVEQFVVLVLLEGTTDVVERPRGTGGDQDESASPEATEAALDFPGADPADPGSGEDPTTDPGPGTGEEPTDPGPGTGEEPTDPGAGEDPTPDPGPGTGEEPTDPDPGTGEEPRDPGTGEEPTNPDPGTGEEPTDPNAGTGEEPTNPDPNAGTGEEPTDPNAGTGEEPTDPNAGNGEEPTDPNAGNGEEPAPDGTTGGE